MAKETRLTFLQSKFIDYYLANGGNGTQAARAAGYKGNDNVLAVTAHNNLRNPKIRAALDARMKDLTMSANEVLYQLTQQARSDARQLAGLNVEQIKVHPMGVNIKEFEHTVNRIGELIIQETIKVKLYDKQAAVVHLGKYHRLFTERVEVDWVRELRDAGLDPEAIEEELAQQFEQHIRRGAPKAVPFSLEEGENTD